MTTKTKTTKGNWLIVEGLPGLTISPGATPLTRLHYFDGKFLRAADLELEQRAQRRLVELSNVAGGFGFVHGFDTTLAGDDLLSVGAGQAIDAAGHVLLLPLAVEVSITELIERSRELTSKGKSKALDKAEALFEDCTPVAAVPPTMTPAPDDLWLITVAHAEFLCGTEDVYGKLCEEACVSTTDRPYLVEGVVLRARPLQLEHAYPSSGAVVLGAIHLRSRVASAYFADERQRPASLISGAGLRSKIWCLGAELSDGEVALGVLCRKGIANLWFDAWTARRERMQTPPRNYWAHRMAMRPWSEFLAQVLQFQCQLADLLCMISRGGGGFIDPCAKKGAAISAANDTLVKLLDKLAGASVELRGALGYDTIATLEGLRSQLEAAKGAELPMLGDGNQILIDGGIVELPPAGYLPVDPNSELSVDRQVRRLLGDGVDPRFCVIRPDDAARELEGAQHMDRISLLRGLDDPNNKDPVDILVPDGRLIVHKDQDQGLSYRAKFAIGTVDDLGDLFKVAPNMGEASKLFEQLAASARYRLRGAARAARRTGGGASFCCAAVVHERFLVGLDLKPMREMSLAYRNTVEPEDEQLRVGEYALNKLKAAYLAPKTMVGEMAEMAVLDNQDVIVKPRPKSIAAWCELGIDADPFAVANHTPIGFAAELRAASSGEPVRYRLSGELTVSQRTSYPSGAELLSAKITGFELIEGDSTNSNTPASYAVMLVRGSGTSNTVVMALKPVQAKLDHDLMLTWNGQTLQVTGASFHQTVEDKDDELFFEVHDLVHDQAVRDAGDPDHQAALAAVQMIANAIQTPSFAAEAANKLFPPAQAASSYEVQAVLDWVLFHARHRKQCVGELPSKPPAPGRVYRVYTRDFDNLDELMMVAEMLMANSEDLGQFPLEEVGLVEYAPGVSALRTSSGAITALWKPHGDGERLAWVGIASEGQAAAEGEDVSRGRALALEQVVEPISPPIDKQKTTVLKAVPRGLAAEDGVIVLLTLRQQQSTSCHSVYWINPGNAGKIYAEQLARAGTWDQLEKGFEDSKATGNWDFVRLVGKVHFDGPTMLTHGAELLSNWNQVSGNCPASNEMFSVYAGSDSAAGTVELRATQRNVIAKRLAVQTQPVDESELDTLPAGCPIRTFIYPEVNRLFFSRIVPGRNTFPQFKEYVEKGDIDGLLQSALAPFNFGSTISNFNSAELIWAELNKVEPDEKWSQVFVFTRTSDTTLPPPDIITAQVKAGLKLIGVPATIVLTPEQTTQDWKMGGGDVMVLVVRSFI